MPTMTALVVGDLHISDKYSGRHVDYFQDCVDFLTDITKQMEQHHVTHLFITGDFVGRTTEKNLKSRDAFLYFLKVLQVWNNMTDGHVYSNRGNHDISETLTDFDCFESLGFVRVPSHVDMGAIRFHLLNYGEHDRQIEVDDSKYNAVIAHSELHVDGLTSWFFRSKEAVDLATLDNLYGADIVIGGHIHTPSVRMVTTQIRDREVSLFYPGNGTRPKYDQNLWTKCYGVLFSTDGENVSLGQVEFTLKPVDQVFRSTFDDYPEEQDDSQAPVFNVDQLAEILQQLNNYNLIGDGDYKTQVVKLGGLDKDAVDLALKYIAQVEGEMK